MLLRVFCEQICIQRQILIFTFSQALQQTTRSGDNGGASADGGPMPIGIAKIRSEFN